ncbi:MAG: ComEC/Rec2 family competence protein [Robiginitomaculum sp.]|nr:ComEC/Rec2 family competence protein [Robiginitomaculum sp.]
MGEIFLSGLNTAKAGLVSMMARARFEWCLVAFGAGIAVYFSMATEPGLWPGLVAMGVLAALVLASGKYLALREMLVLGLFLVAGLSRAIYHTQMVQAPILPDTQRAYTVNGWIENIKSSGKLQHFFIRVQNIERLDTDKTPVRIRLRIKPYDFKPGDSIHIRALLKTPPGPAIVGGYDSGRASYFKQIGGSGFAISKAKTAEFAPLPLGQRLERRLVKFRYGLSRHIQARAPPRTAGLQSALLTGDRSAIAPAQAQALRDAGLAHLLAISGLHMGLLAGGSYFLMSLFLASIGPLARRYDMRKWAAATAILTATAYLLISGASVSTTRAFIMAVVVFSAVILGRRALSMRSVALAAAITLVLHPENILSSGFHMSFAATAALIAVYRYWADRRVYTRPANFARRMWSGFTGMAVTSFVAGGATGGFAALHFQRFARLGFLANILAMPMFTLVAMPAGFLAVLVMPLGLDKLPLLVMGKALDYVLAVAVWVSEMDGALMYFKSANGQIISLFALGFVFLCLGPKRIRITGFAMLIGSWFMWAGIHRPDMRISDKARVAFWDTRDVNILTVDRKRGDGFGRARFIEQAGLKTAELRTFKDAGTVCDIQACRIELKEKIISIVHTPEGVAEACTDSDLVILTLREAGPRTRRQCGVPLLDIRELSQNGARDIHIKNGKLKIRKTNPKARKARPWG